MSKYEQCKYCPNFVDTAYLALEEEILVDDFFYRRYYPYFYYNPLYFTAFPCRR
jgi:hypothetical protein